jgi:hypothetical protein
VPTLGGNIVIYKNITGFNVVCEEFTHFKYELNTAEQFVAL